MAQDNFKEGPNANLITVAVSGYFNPLHKGHIQLFEEAKKLGDKLIVIINNDQQRDLKGSKEFMQEDERKFIVESLRCVDEAVISVDVDKTVCKSLELIKPTIFANGGDRKNVDDIPESQICQKHGIRMIFNVGGEKVQSSSWLLGTKVNGVNGEFDISGKNVIIADVDETICESCMPIAQEMAEHINHLIKSGFIFAFISGTHVEELLRMISSKISQKHHLLGTTGTNYTVVENNKQTQIYNLSFSNEEKEEIFIALEKLITCYNLVPMTSKTDQLQDRDSQITLSPLGRNAPLELKKQYDPDGQKRKKFVEYLQQHIDFDKYDIKIGGTTSIDITKKGLDKEWGIKEFLQYHNISVDRVMFFGDKIYPGGNDYPASKIVDCVAVKNHEDTLEKFKKYFPLSEINLES